jgi:hypothetical protein
MIINISFEEKIVYSNYTENGTEMHGIWIFVLLFDNKNRF